MGIHDYNRNFVKLKPVYSLEYIFLILLFIVILLQLFISYFKNYPRPCNMAQNYIHTNSDLIYVFLIVILLLYFIDTHNQTKRISYVFPPRRKPFNIIPCLDSLKSSKHYIDECLDIAKLDYSYTSNPEIIEAINHSITGGKRLRSSLLLNVAIQKSKNRLLPHEIIESALAIEYLHSASLIIDDMPCFDNDYIRRGVPTVHKLYGLATAQMSAISLVGLSLECIVRQGDRLMCKCKTNDDLIKANTCMSKIFRLISNSISTSGAPSGQLDEYLICKLRENNLSCDDIDSKKLDLIISRKTGCLFEAAILIGWILGNWDNEDVNERDTVNVRLLAQQYAAAFQIADDIVDVHKDIQSGNGNVNYANIHGKRCAIDKVNNNLTHCKLSLKKLGLWSNVWKEAHNYLYHTIRNT